jgi:hypothetical protein
MFCMYIYIYICTHRHIHINDVCGSFFESFNIFPRTGTTITMAPGHLVNLTQHLVDQDYLMSGAGELPFLCVRVETR